MKVFPERMKRNLDSTHGLVFSGQLLQDLVEHGAPREDSYKWVQGHAMAAWESETSFKERVAADPNIRKFLDEKALRTYFQFAAPAARGRRDFPPRLRREILRRALELVSAVRRASSRTTTKRCRGCFLR